MSNQKTFNILFAGIGGQGVLKASEVCGWAALYDGYHVKKSENHGMAQRGGSVESHLRFGKIVFSPLIPKNQADFLVSFHADEHKRQKSFLKKGGLDFLKILEVGKKIVPDRRFINTYLLGALSKKLPIKDSSWLKAMEVVFPSKFLEENKKIFYLGRKNNP